MSKPVDRAPDGVAYDRKFGEEAETPEDTARKHRSKAMMRALREDMDDRPGVYERLAEKRDQQ